VVFLGSKKEREVCPWGGKRGVGEIQKPGNGIQDERTWEKKAVGPREEKGKILRVFLSNLDNVDRERFSRLM